jgi:dTMP kinase
MTSCGVFISFEGSDGSGKSTQTKLLAERLCALGYSVLDNVEPGGTAVGQQIRSILLDPANAEMSAMAELLLMFASRAQASERRIVPALSRGDIVLSDRFTDSSLAYQGEARGLGFETVRALHHLSIGALYPDLTICLEIDLETSLERARNRNRALASTGARQTRFDDQSFQFHRKVVEGYHKIQVEEPGRFKIIDGRASPEVIAQHVWDLVSVVLPGSLKSVPV